MARALWKGSIAFGLVNIPVELHSAVRESRPRFRLLHADDHAPVRFERVCTREGRPVAWEEVVKGYEYERGHFVVLTKDDFQAAALEKTRTIDIRSFVKGAEIDDRFFETSYYLTPAKGGERAYALLREAMRETGLVGVATIVLRDAQHLAALEVVGDAVVLTMMRHAEELVDLGKYRFPTGVQIRKPELQMARTLVEQLAARWDPAQFTDEYGENLMKIIRARMKGKTVSLPARADERPAEVVDLMERLRRSLAQAGTARRKTKAPARKAASRTKKRRAA
ncbi:MAG TPA: Ku protein [Vicinamibacterales bacterium]|nr:Ku protein [Vicinamibacterales bacterium]